MARPGRQLRRRHTGRQRNFTPRVRTLLYAAIRADLPYKRACEICGVNYRNFNYWMQRGKTDPEHSIYTQFRRYIRRIEARKEIQLLEVIDKVAVGNYKIREMEISFSPDKGRSWKTKTKIIRPDWKAAAWRLERKYRDDYGQFDPTVITSKSPEEIAQEIRDATLELERSVPTEEEIA